MDAKDFIDLHVHVGPDIIPRKFTVSEIIKDEAGKIGGMAFKNHFYPTMPFIKSVGETENLIMIGSVTLNNYLGGLNPNAIYSSAKISERPIIVWFPTINAENFLKQSKYEIPPDWVCSGFKSRLSSEVKGIRIIDKNNNLTMKAMKVLEAIKINKCIMATGHISWQESKILVEEAIRIGVKKIIVTHPIYQLINMPLEIQKELAKNNGVYIEQTYAMNLIDKVPIEKIAAQIKEIKPENCIITSDVGQVKSPNPSNAIDDFVKLLRKSGIKEYEIEKMLIRNPNKLIK